MQSHYHLSNIVKMQHEHILLPLLGRTNPSSSFQLFQAEDKALDHPEPEFIEVPIQQLLPEKWHSDYVRACGGGERGEQKLAKFKDGGCNKSSSH